MKKAILLLALLVSSIVVLANSTDPKVLKGEENYPMSSWESTFSMASSPIPDNLLSCDPDSDAPCIYCSACGSYVVCVQCSCDNCDRELEVLWTILCQAGCCYSTE